MLKSKVLAVECPRKIINPTPAFTALKNCWESGIHSGASFSFKKETVFGDQGHLSSNTVKFAKTSLIYFFSGS